MKENKYSPWGEWVLRFSKDGGFEITKRGNEDFTIVQRASLPYVQDSIALGNLLFASQDMLAMLEELDRFFVTGDEPVPMGMRLRIREAVLKARGEWNG